MAITKIWKVAYSLQGAVDYAGNLEKCADTDFAQHADSVTNAVDYAMNPGKTDSMLFVSGVNCAPDTAVQDMERTKRRFSKTGGILAFHAVQSFLPGEVTPAECHAIGVELAQRMWGDRFEVVVATHLDHKHLHNHFVLNSVSFADGKRYYDNKHSYYGQLRKNSDALCREHGLSVIGRDDTQSRAKNYADWKDGATIRDRLKADLDRHVLTATSWADFKRQLQAEGFAVEEDPRHKYVTVLPPYGIKPLRLKASALGSDYTPDQLCERIAFHRLTGQTLARRSNRPRRTQYRVVGTLTTIRAARPKLHGFAALYWHYMYVLGKAGKRRTKLSPQQRCDVTRQLRRFEQIKARAHFLRAHQISTLEQLTAYRSAAQLRMDSLCAERQVLYNHRRGDPQERHRRIAALTEQIGAWRTDIKLCDSIERESVVMDERRRCLHNALRPNKKETDKNHEIVSERS